MVRNSSFLLTLFRATNLLVRMVLRWFELVVAERANPLVWHSPSKADLSLCLSWTCFGEQGSFEALYLLSRSRDWGIGDKGFENCPLPIIPVRTLCRPVDWKVSVKIRPSGFGRASLKLLLGSFCGFAQGGRAAERLSRQMPQRPIFPVC